MVNPCWPLLGAVLPVVVAVAAQQVGSVRGVVHDKDFDTPLAAAKVTIVETGQTVTTTDDGHFVFSQVAPGKYTLIFSKDGYSQQVRSDVQVTDGQLTDVDAALSGDFTEMEEFVVEDMQIGGSEAALLKLRLESPALIDSISSELMSRAGASDAAAALNLVAGATVENGKYATIRGLPDRYVVSQLNGVRLPTADEDKRAVELDQYPASIIKSIQVSKTFTPDQQGDASGGAVNVLLKGIPDQNTFSLKGQVGYNSQVTGNNDFLSYKGGGVNFLGRRDDPPQALGTNWTGAVGTSTTEAPIDYKFNGEIGGKHEFDNGVKIGGFIAGFYERDSAFFDNGVDNSLWVTTPGGSMVPQTIQGTPGIGDFKTQLYDVTQGTQSVQWGGLATAGIESKNHSVNIAYLYTSNTDDQATLAIDTRGKSYFFPGYNPNDPAGVGHAPDELTAAPYQRNETLTYTERTTSTLMLNGHHRFEVGDTGIDNFFTFGSPEVDWGLASSTATLNQPDKRQFGAVWYPASLNPGVPGIIPPFISEPLWQGFKPAANFTLGNEQRIWKDITEDATEYDLNLKFPFKQWTDTEGYFKFGLYNDKVTRAFNQDTFSNFNDNSTFSSDFNDPWSSHFPSQDHPITDGPPFVDVDYNGNETIGAWYAMVDMPVASFLHVIGGARFESTNIGIVNTPEADATWFPPGATAPVHLNPGDADVDYSQDDVLPSIGFTFTPIKQLTFRGSYSQTVARMTFKELTPIIQQEFLGGPIFIGNPDLVMSNITNYDLRLDYTPYDGALLSASWFFKDVVNPIEYVQAANAGFTYTTPSNYPKGQLSGWEFEIRQNLGHFIKTLDGLAVGANATFIDSQVTLPAAEAALFDGPGIQAPMSTRPMTGAPDHLFNLYLTYDFARTGTQFGVFYTVRGDTLAAGATATGSVFVPSIFETQYATLNMTLTQNLGKHFKLQVQAKNLTNPEIQTVYRSKYIGSDVLHTSYTAGIDLSLGLFAQFDF